MVEMGLLDDDYSDEQLEAECRMLGSLLRSPEVLAGCDTATSSVGFCVPFHAAIFAALMLRKELRLPATPQDIWALVSCHPDSEVFGLDHLVELADEAAKPEMFVFDLFSVVQRGAEIMLLRLLPSEGGFH